MSARVFCSPTPISSSPTPISSYPTPTCPTPCSSTTQPKTLKNLTSKLPKLPKQTNKQKFKVRQPQRAAKSKRPNAPADGSKNNGIHTTKQEEYPSRHPTTDTANSSTSKQSTSRRLKGVSKSNTIQSTNQAGGPVSPPHMYHPRRPAYQPRLIPKHVAI